MSNFKKYRFIAAVLSLSIFIGTALPAGLHATCNDAESMHSKQEEEHQTSTHEECPMASANVPDENHFPEQTKQKPVIHDLGFACACAIDEAPIKTEAQIQFKTKVPVLWVVQVLNEIHIRENQKVATYHVSEDAYSPPPIYLANESFLN